jgi:hypothetical protein
MSDPTAWLALTVSGKREHGGNDGYPDVPSSSYRWDSTVPHSAVIKAGDVIALWDKRALLGVSVIEEIATTQIQKSIYKCPSCQNSSIKTRNVQRPTYRCYGCKHEFEIPIRQDKEVTSYASQHEAAWIDLQGVLSGRELRKLCFIPGTQHSFRKLDWLAFTEAIGRHVEGFAFPLLKITQERVRGGHSLVTVRVRIGQANFRRLLLQEHGHICAFTGPAPAAVLEAAHLYSYADHARHHAHGGLLMRRDLHRLFDLGQLAINPITKTIDIAPSIAGFSEYARLHGSPLHAPIEAGHIKWLNQHWRTHRPEASAAI